MRELSVNLKDHSYNIYIENEILSNLEFYIKKVYTKKNIFIITDENVALLYLEKVLNSLSSFKTQFVVIPAGEDSKNINVYANICEELLNKDIRRGDLLIALGGGVIGDMTGFVAATLYRGLPYIGIPTSLLAQMDSSIGGKTGIDFHDRKNIIGAFKQPLMVLIDPNTIETLNEREFNNGMGELIKHGAIGNYELLKKLYNKPKIDEDIIYESLTVKKKVVEVDEFDTGLRMTLNFGHTFGHAIELKYHYKHGEAVAIGMLMAIKMANDLNIGKKEFYDEILKIIKIYNLPSTEFNYKDFLNDVLYDKKNISGTVSFIFLEELGSAIIYKMTEEEIKRLI